MSEFDRRRLICGGCAAALVACTGRTFVDEGGDDTGGVGPPGDDDDDTDTDPQQNFDDPLDNPDYPCNQPIDIGGAGWSGIQIANHPELDEVGVAMKGTTDSGLQYLLVQVEPGCYVAAARRCTHQGALIDYHADRGQFVCPLHASVFNQDGSVAGGPAGAPIAVYFAGRDGDQVWVKLPA